MSLQQQAVTSVRLEDEGASGELEGRGRHVRQPVDEGREADGGETLAILTGNTALHVS